MIFFPQPKPPKHKKKNKIGEWNKIRDNEIIPQFQKWGIETCEIGLYPCVKFRYLGFAHTKKRREIKTPEDLRQVVLACNPCHTLVEYSCVETTGKSMTEFLEEIIKKRKQRLSMFNKKLPAYDRPLG